MPRTMALIHLLFVWIACNTFLIIKSEPAQWLVRYEPGKNISFEVNKDALTRLSKLKQPIKVISAIGDARVGKSTTLNFIRHAWKSSALGDDDDGNVEEVFKTGHEHDTVTHGIWMSSWREHDENIVLLDVEGIDLGNDAATYHLSMFTALMSSGFGVFCSGTVTNHIIDFLYTLPRASEKVFKEIEESKNFGHLHVVVREPLQLPPGKSLEQVVKDKIYSTTQGAADEKTALIAKYFPAYETGVSEIPRTVNFNEKPDIKHNPKYWDAIKTLSGRFKKLPAKKTVHGALVNGAVMAEIAEILAERMTNDSWMDIGDTYLIIEKLACASSYRTHIEPILRMTSSSKDVEARISSSVQKYKQECALETERENAEKELKGRIELLRFSEEKDQEIKKLKDDLYEEKQKRERAEPCGSSYWTWMMGALVFGMAGMAFSDIKLKQDITTVGPSEYNVLGLREVAWAWNEDARRLGVSGEARGVIAQEVEKLYPWVVVTGPDGYKRVNYTALDLMVVACKANEVLSSFLFKSPRVRN